MSCSFCGSSEEHARCLVAGPSAVICDRCAERALRVVKERGPLGWFLRPLWRGMESAHQEGQAWTARVIVPAAVLGVWVASRLGGLSPDPIVFQVPTFVVAYGTGLLLVFAALPLAQLLWGVSPKISRLFWGLFSLATGAMLGSAMGLAGVVSGIAAALVFLWMLDTVGRRVRSDGTASS